MLNDKFIKVNAKYFKIDDEYIMLTEEDFKRKQEALDNLKPTKVLHLAEEYKNKKGKQNNEFRKKSKKK